MSNPDLDFESDLTELSDDDEYVPEPPATEDSEIESDSSSEADYLNGPLLNYEFERGEKVWVYAYDGWYPGSVLRRAQIPDRPKVAHLRVLFRRYNVRIQKDFAPADGTIKPDTPRIRQELRAAKWIE
ncbi:hypothetical protein FOMPIDRAFT_1051863 [Fomitopsis schrenkii]|uniref:Uncharacterized protein n=1 Tax=Fomitopsis schrenkii TaxID=2126942 RepID=S8F8Y7_FOMSC|nr:hypothetical protein FOMPIDRAFT_1051863 [Fomitopsis schrenkii]